MTDTAWKISRNGRTYRRGNVTVADNTGNRTVDEMRQLADVVWTLNGAYPPARPGPVRVTVEPADNPWFTEGGNDPNDPAGYVGGLTNRHSSTVRLNDRNYADTDNGDGGMPVGATTIPWLYTLVHEWGHVSDSGLGTRDTFLEWALSGRWLSEYGQTAPVEGNAEAFAEWVLSGGMTRNRAARQYAHDFRWSSPPKITRPTHP